MSSKFPSKRSIWGCVSVKRHSEEVRIVQSLFLGRGDSWQRVTSLKEEKPEDKTGEKPRADSRLMEVETKGALREQGISFYSESPFCHTSVVRPIFHARSWCGRLVDSGTVQAAVGCECKFRLH